MKEKITEVLMFQNGNVAVFAEGRDTSVNELNTNVIELWAKFAESKGYEVDGTFFRVFGEQGFVLFRIPFGWNTRPEKRPMKA